MFKEKNDKSKNFIEETKASTLKNIKTIIKRQADELTDEEKISDQGIM